MIVSKIKCEDVVIGWCPNRPPFEKHAKRGRVFAYVLPETAFTWDLPFTVGANTAGWRETGVAGRQEWMQLYVTQMLGDDNIQLDAVRCALCQVDEWRSFPFSI